MIALAIGYLSLKNRGGFAANAAQPQHLAFGAGHLPSHREITSVIVNQMSDQPIPNVFLTHAASILADTDTGLSGSKIIALTSAYAVDFNANIPHNSTAMASNKRTVLKDNLAALPGLAQYRLMKEMCEMDRFKDNAQAKELKIKLVSNFGHLYDKDGGEVIAEPLIQEAKHWLEPYKAAHASFASAEQKYRNRIFSRNLLDDLRLALELFLKEFLNNDKPLEKQASFIGTYLETKGATKEFRNMFIKLIDYYALYQNNNVKHHDSVVEEELEFVFELTASFIKHILRLNNR